MTHRVKLMIFTAALCRVTRRHMPLNRTFSRLENMFPNNKDMKLRKFKNEKRQQYSKDRAIVRIACE